MPPKPDLEQNIPQDAETLLHVTDVCVAFEAIANELSRYGRLVSPIKRIPLGCKSSLVKHLVSFRRMVYMVFKEEQGILFGPVLKGKVTPVFLSDQGKKQLSLLWSFPLRPQFGRLWKAPAWLLHLNRQRANPKPSLQPKSPLELQ
ncbi:hypothetical protein QTP86_013048 [Hemibagrus guttatus]|nr:hypothetical protein QTP86_013048 [Hemibagrus guttatus]